LISWVLMQSLNYLEKVTDPKYKRKASKTSWLQSRIYQKNMVTWSF
jgi:hypothetical protein